MKKETNKPVKLIICSYSRMARDRVVTVVKKVFKQAGITEYTDDIFACIDELIKNAIKANYKFILVLDKIKNTCLAEENNHELRDYWSNISRGINNQEFYDRVVSAISCKEEVTTEVRDILNEESKYMSIMNRIYNEKREHTPEEKEVLNNLTKLHKIRSELKKKRIKTQLKIVNNGSNILIEVTNSSPILSNDLKRIHKKREEYKKYHIAGKEYEFFINNLDTSDSGFGLGYAKIDSFLSNMGLDTDNTVSIISSSNTKALISIPIESLKDEGGEIELLPV